MSAASRLSGTELTAVAGGLLLALGLLLPWYELTNARAELNGAGGEMTAVVSIAAFGLVLYAGVIDRPGSPEGLVALRWGGFVALAGVLLALAGAALRASTSERPRKPPGVL